MKTIVLYALTAAITASVTSCGEPVQKFKVEVVDESNSPMPDAEVAAWFNKPGKSSPLASYKVVGTTNGKGMVEIRGETVWYQTSVSSQPPGYYESMKFDHWTKKRNGSRWEPWPVEVRLVMKKIGKPHPMYAIRPKDGVSFGFPTAGELGPVGFDLELRDWIEPYGKGKIADLIISGALKDPSDPGYREENGRTIMSRAKGFIRINFSNPDDGILRVEDDGGSKLAGPVMAPLQGYKATSEFANWNEEAAPLECHVFRVRTVRDGEGRIVSARYGKIDGKLMASFGKRSFVDMTYYFNQEDNDRNMEWDGETNLFKDLDRVNWPERN